MNLVNSLRACGTFLGACGFIVMLFGQPLVAQNDKSDGKNAAPAQPGQSASSQGGISRKEKAEQQLKQEEHQRILGVVPAFNTVNVPDAVALSPRQKFKLAWASAIDPFTFVAAAADAGISQWENNFAGYGQGTEGYAKRFGASYADTFDGTMLGNAIFPILLHQDPRYFRKGTGTISARIVYTVLSAVRCKNDDGKWVPNYSNVLGNLAAGGVSNLYYPSTDRGAGLTISRALTVSAEGALGALAFEFWPDISRKLHKPRP